MAFGTTPLSTTTLGTNQFPVSAVAVPGASGGNLTALEGGPASTDGNGNSTAPASTYTKDGGNVALGTTTDAANANTIIGQLKQIKTNTASVTIGNATLAVTQSGTWTIQPGNTPNTTPWLITLNQGGNSATVTASNALKVDGSAVTQPVSGTFWQATQPVSGTVTANVGTTNGLALDASVTGLQVAQGSTTSGEKGTLIQGAVTTASPSYTTAQTSPLSLTTAGAVRVDGSATTQPVSGTFWQATQPVSGTVTANQGGSNWSTNLVQANGTTIDTNSGVKSAGTIRMVLATDQPQLTNALKVDGSAVTQPVSGTFWQATQPVSGSVTANIGTSGSLALDASVTALQVAQGSTTSGQKGDLIQGAVTTNAPSYTTAQTSPLSLDTSGLLRLSLKDTPANTNNLNVAIAASSATVTVSGTITANQGGAPWSSNITQIAGSSISTAATGVQKVGIVGNGGATVDSTVGAGSAPTNALVVGSIYNTSAPAPTNGQAMAFQADQAGNTRVFPGIALATLAAWNSGTSLNATQTIYTNSGVEAVLVQLTQTTTLTGGAVTFEVTYDGSNWSAIPANCVLDPTSNTFAQISVPYTVQASTNKAFLINSNGAQGLRAKLSTQITGSGSVTPNYALLPASPADTIVALSPTAANFNVSVGAALPAGGNTIGAVTQASGPWTNNITQLGGTTVDTNSGSKSAGTMRVVLATDQPALTNTLLIQPQAGTTGGSTISHTMSGASTNATSLKASAGLLYGLTISNANASARYFKLYNKASSPTVGSDTPVTTIQVPGSGTVIRVYPVGLVLGTGIAWAATTGIADADTGAVGANDLSIDIDYK